jgi:hypothetical protein
MGMDAVDAALRVLGEEAEPLHWTRIQDLALRRGYLDPFTTPDVRAQLLAALASAVRDGRIRKVERGVYALAAT